MSTLDDADTTPLDCTQDEQPLLSALNRDIDIDPDADVVLKSESHFSTGDLREELELIRTGAFNAIVFEGARENVEEVPDQTFSDYIVAFPFFFLNFLYTDQKPLLVAALRRDADVRFTRETDGDIIQDLPSTLQNAVHALVLVLAVCIAYFAARAITQPPSVIASFAAFVGIFSVPIVIRKARGKLASNEMNRNEIMSRRIETVIDDQEDGKVLAPVGASHAEPVRDRLPETLNVDIVSPAYGFLSKPAMKEFVPGILKSIVLLLAVWVVLAVFGALAVLAVDTVITVPM